MLLPNNPELDARALEAKLKAIDAHRRRPQPLLAGTPPADENSGKALLLTPAGEASGWRAAIKRLPVIGPLAAAAYRRLRYVAMPGLTWKQRLRVIPLVGSAAAWVYNIVRLNAIRHQLTQEVIALRQLHAGVTARLNQVDQQFGAVQEQLGAARERLQQLEVAASAQGNRLALLEQSASRIDPMQADAAQSRDRIAQLEALNISQVLAFHENRIAGLTQELHAAMVRAPAAHAPAGAAPEKTEQTAESFDEDAFYIEFEGLFRGTREEIQNRQRVYLPYLERFAGDASATVVDVGCGRGEWLELLKEQGINSIGIDLNAAMVDTCRERGLAAECTDAIAYLRRQPEGSLAAVTGFHIIEHLPFGTMVALFDAALRALRSDGLIIFETPNPENLTVGACNFYYDPTHLHPIVPVVAEFIARQRGFAHAEILRLHPYPDSLRIAEDNETARLINKVLYGPQDFSVLAWKTHAN